MQSSQANNKLKNLVRGKRQRTLEFFLSLGKRFHLNELLLSVIFSTLLVAMIRHSFGSFRVPQLRSGEIASFSVRSPISFDVDDSEDAARQREQLVARVAPVYDFDPAMLDRTIERWRRSVRAMRKKPKDQWGKSKLASEIFGFFLSDEETRTLMRTNWSQDLERSISFSMGPLFEQKIIEQKEHLRNGISVFDLKSAKSKLLQKNDIPSILSVEEARALVSRAARTGARSRRDVSKMPWTAWRGDLREKIFAIQSRMIRPNLTYSREKSEAYRLMAVQGFKPEALHVERGDPIVRKGERVTARSEKLLFELSRKSYNSPAVSRIVVESLFCAFFLWLIALFLRQQYSRQLSGTKNTIVVAGIVLTSVACFKLTALFIFNIVANQFGNIPATFFLFLVPIAAPAMIVRLLIHTSFATVASIFFAMAIAIMLGNGGAIGAHVLAVSLMSVQFLKYCRTRTSLHVAGIKTALIASASSLAVVLVWGGSVPSQIGFLTVDSSQDFSWMEVILWTVAGGFIGGWMSSALTLIVTPVLENILDYTTDLKLLELARMDNELLKNLVMKAPGTYHHSIVVGSLVEAACEAVGVDALLARVGAYYHDIGKIGRAEYFVENQTSGRNPHDQISPHMSAKIIISHVKEGVKMATDARLGASMIDFIQTHHGTSLVSYFYNKAKQEAAQPRSRLDSKVVDEEDFRYPGPRPRTKEAAIVALADSCEAATRSLVEPTPARIEGMVKKILSKAFNEGLLDEAEITLAEVNTTGRAFVRILMGIHHNRIQYQDQEAGLPESSPNTLSFIKSRGST